MFVHLFNYQIYCISYFSFFLDIDECLKNPCHPDASCKNNNGSHTCTCNSGYSGNGTHCTDNNECNKTPKPCSSLVNCTNTPGSYKCSPCPNGYGGNGSVCNGMYNTHLSIFLYELTCFMLDAKKNNVIAFLTHNVYCKLYTG